MVSDSLSSSEGGDGITATAPFFTYAEKFEELFPYYLSIGMNEEQFWDKDSRLVIAYRKAEEHRANRRNAELWLQGAYFYEALQRVAPVLHSFAKKGTKPIPYLEEPFSLTGKQEEIKREKKEMEIFNKGKARMENFMVQYNKKFEGK